MNYKFIKLAITLLVILTGQFANAQVFYKTYEDQEFQKLLKDGVIFVSESDEKIDTFITNSLQQQWKSTPLEIIDGSTCPCEIDKNQYVLAEMDLGVQSYFNFEPYERVLIITKYKYLTRFNVPIEKSIGYVRIEDFYRKKTQEKSNQVVSEAITKLSQGIRKVELVYNP